MLSRRSLLKALAACTGVGLFCKAATAKVAPPAPEVCDPFPLPLADFERGIHNATFVRWLTYPYIEVRLTNGPHRVVAAWGFGKAKAGDRLIVSPYFELGLMVEKRFED